MASFLLRGSLLIWASASFVPACGGSSSSALEGTGGHAPDGGDTGGAGGSSRGTGGGTAGSDASTSTGGTSQGGAGGTSGTTLGELPGVLAPAVCRAASQCYGSLLSYLI